MDPMKMSLAAFLKFMESHHNNVHYTDRLISMHYNRYTDEYHLMTHVDEGEFDESHFDGVQSKNKDFHVAFEEFKQKWLEKFVERTYLVTVDRSVKEEYLVTAMSKEEAIEIVTSSPPSVYSSTGQIEFIDAKEKE